MYYDKMKEARKNAKLTQSQIADVLGIDQRQYSRYEQGKNEMPIRYLKEFCVCCKVSADYILEIENVN